MSIYLKLQDIQEKLKAPKNQFNSFGKYNYRNCEDILEGVKPLLKENGCVLIIKDSIELIGNRYYVKATAQLIDVETAQEVISEALAREEDSKKGMDSCQVTGSASSYARKYALNGLFAIDDTKDADSGKVEEKKPQQDKLPQEKLSQEKLQQDPKLITPDQRKMMFAVGKSDEAKIKSIIARYGYTSSKDIKKSDFEKIIKDLEAA